MLSFRYSSYAHNNADNGSNSSCSQNDKIRPIFFSTLKRLAHMIVSFLTMISQVSLRQCTENRQRMLSAPIFTACTGPGVCTAHAPPDPGGWLGSAAVGVARRQASASVFRKCVLRRASVFRGPGCCVTITSHLGGGASWQICVNSLFLVC